MFVQRSPLDPPVMLLGSRNFSPPANMPPPGWPQAASWWWWKALCVGCGINFSILTLVCLALTTTFQRTWKFALPDDVGIVNIRKIPTIRTNLLLNHGNIRVSHGDFSFKIVPPSVWCTTPPPTIKLVARIFPTSAVMLRRMARDQRPFFLHLP